MVAVRARQEKTFKPEKISRPHMRIPVEDERWARIQKPSVKQLFSECWECDPYGSRWMQLNTKLKTRAFRSARKALEEQDLFIFRPVKSQQDAKATLYWEVKNLHGSRVKSFWKDGTQVQQNSTQVQQNSTQVQQNGTAVPPIGAETQSQSGFQNRSVTPQELLINSSKELIRSEDRPKRREPLEGGFATEVGDLREEELDSSLIAPQLHSPQPATAPVEERPDEFRAPSACPEELEIAIAASDALEEFKALVEANKGLLKPSRLEEVESFSSEELTRAHELFRELYSPLGKKSLARCLDMAVGAVFNSRPGIGKPQAPFEKTWEDHRPVYPKSGNYEPSGPD